MPLLAMPPQPAAYRQLSAGLLLIVEETHTVIAKGHVAAGAGDRNGPHQRLNSASSGFFYVVCRFTLFLALRSP